MVAKSRDGFIGGCDFWIIENKYFPFFFFFLVMNIIFKCSSPYLHQIKLSHFYEFDSHVIARLTANCLQID